MLLYMSGFDEKFEIFRIFLNNLRSDLCDRRNWQISDFFNVELIKSDGSSLFWFFNVGWSNSDWENVYFLKI